MNAEESKPSETGPSGPSKRALRTMAVVRWILLALVTALALVSIVTIWGKGATGPSLHAETYYCPMHPEVRSHEPGECPICHMDLVPIPSERQDTHQHGLPTGASAGPDADSQPADSQHAGPKHPSTTTEVVLSEEKQRAVGLSTSLVEESALQGRLRVPAVLSAPETGRSEVRVRAPGFVEEVAVRQTGVRVTRGQPLAYVYSPEIYRAQEEFLAVQRWNAVPPSEGTSPSGTTEVAAASRRGLELLGLTSADIEQLVRTGQPKRAIAVRAPAGGVVLRTSAILGSRTGPEMVLYEIADLSSLWLIASVHERDLAHVRVGTQARFALAGSQGEPLLGKVDLVEPLLDEATRTTRVRMVVDNRDGSLRPGQFGDVELDLPASSGLFVPRDAVIRTGEHEYVYVLLPPDRFEPRSVTTGPVRDGRVQVLSGLSAGERVVTRGTFMLDSESRLAASLSGAPAAPSSSAQPASPQHSH